jgi:hypothetical protein
MRDSIIKHKNLGEILVQIENSNIDKHALSSVLRDPPPLIFIFIASLIGTAFTIWLYHKILGYLCTPKKTTKPDDKKPCSKNPEHLLEETFSERIRRYSPQELESSLLGINKERHPNNYHLLCAELEKRKSQQVNGEIREKTGGKD